MLTEKLTRKLIQCTEKPETEPSVVLVNPHLYLCGGSQVKVMAGTQLFFNILFKNSLVSKEFIRLSHSPSIRSRSVKQA